MCTHLVHSLPEHVAQGLDQSEDPCGLDSTADNPSVNREGILDSAVWVHRGIWTLPLLLEQVWREKLTKMFFRIWFISRSLCQIATPALPTANYSTPFRNRVPSSVKVSHGLQAPTPPGDALTWGRRRDGRGLPPLLCCSCSGDWVVYHQIQITFTITSRKYHIHLWEIT